MQTSTDKTTPLHAWHAASGARLESFCGYDMPLWYSSVKTEHLAVLQTAGLFDTSHMGLLRISGRDARELLQLCFSRDLRTCCQGGRASLTDGRCVYGVFLDAQGQVIDDAIVNQIESDHYLVVVNACMAPQVAEHLRSHQKDRRVDIKDLEEQFGKIDLQGPNAARILHRILADPEAVFSSFPYFSFKGMFTDPDSSAVRLRDATPLLLSRSGYTGEFGFELFVAAGSTVQVWETVLAAGKDLGCLPCGLAARDSLRTGAGLPLSHQDIGPWPFANNPWTFALPVDSSGQGFTKEFIGGQALLELEDAPHTLAFVGQDPRKVSTEDTTTVTDQSGSVIGKVLTCATDMGIGRRQNRVYSINSPDRPPDFNPKGLACGFVRVDKSLKPGAQIMLHDSKRQIPAWITKVIRPDTTARKPLHETS